MDDAYYKASSINKQVTLISVNNVDVCSYSEGEKNSCVTICATVRVKYCLSENLTNDDETNIEEDIENNDENNIVTKDITTYPAYCI